MNRSGHLRLNHIGTAILLFNRNELPPMRLGEEPNLHELSEGKKYVLREQARVFLKRVSDPLLRKNFCTVGSGQGIVVRFAPTGKKAYYELSPYFKRALEVIPPPKEKLTDETAEVYVRKVLRIAARMRGARRSNKGHPLPNSGL